MDNFISVIPPKGGKFKQQSYYLHLINQVIEDAEIETIKQNASIINN